MCQRNLRLALGHAAPGTRLVTKIESSIVLSRSFGTNAVRPGHYPGGGCSCLPGAFLGFLA
jgi:hypothetical protein